MFVHKNSDGVSWPRQSCQGKQGTVSRLKVLLWM